MKSALVALILICLPIAAEARPSPYPPPEQFAGDRYAGRTSQMGTDVVRAVRVQRRAKRHRRHHQLAHVVHGRPSAWCGWWLGQHLGMTARNLWLARNWAAVGTNSGGPQVGAIVVWPHHVGIITGRRGNQWVIKSGNDGHAVRERPRSIAGAIAFRTIGWRG